MDRETVPTMILIYHIESLWWKNAHVLEKGENFLLKKELYSTKWNEFNLITYNH